MKKLLMATALSMTLMTPAALYAQDMGDDELSYEQMEMLRAAEQDKKAAAMDAVSASGEAAVAAEVAEEKAEMAEQAAEVAEEAAEAAEEAAEKAQDAAEEVVQEVAEEATTEAVPLTTPPSMRKPMETAEENLSELPAVPAPAVESQAVPVAENVSSAAHDWGYTGAKSAPYWGRLNAAYELCATGTEQSPVNISTFLQDAVPAITPAYQGGPLSITNNGHTVQVNYAPGSTMSVGGVSYELKQTQFHTPSEHYLDGAPYPMEAHFVHQAADGTWAVVGVMMKLGAHNPVIEGIWLNAPANDGGERLIDTVQISAGDLMPSSLDYYHYQGSLTAPPCTEGVQWYVLKDPIEMSEIQLKAFQSLFPVNARPVQPLGERVITGN